MSAQNVKKFPIQKQCAAGKHDFSSPIFNLSGGIVITTGYACRNCGTAIYPPPTRPEDLS